MLLQCVVQYCSGLWLSWRPFKNERRHTISQQRTDSDYLPSFYICAEHRSNLHSHVASVCTFAALRIKVSEVAKGLMQSTRNLRLTKELCFKYVCVLQCCNRHYHSLNMLVSGEPGWKQRTSVKICSQGKSWQVCGANDVKTVEKFYVLKEFKPPIFYGKRVLLYTAFLIVIWKLFWALFWTGLSTDLGFKFLRA